MTVQAYQCSNLRSAIYEGDDADVKRVLSKRNYSVIDGDNSCLIDAINEEVAPELIKIIIQGATRKELNFTNLVWRTAMHTAAGQANEPVIRWLCEAGADVNGRDTMKETPLTMAAIRAGTPTKLTASFPQVLSTVKTLIEYGACSGDADQWEANRLLDRYLALGRDLHGGPHPELITLLVASNACPLPDLTTPQILRQYTPQELNAIQDAIEQGLDVLRKTRVVVMRVLLETAFLSQYEAWKNGPNVGNKTPGVAVSGVNPMVFPSFMSIIGDYIHEKPTREGHV